LQRYQSLHSLPPQAVIANFSLLILESVQFEEIHFT
jgi:hypothetical protein